MAEDINRKEEEIERKEEEYNQKRKETIKTLWQEVSVKALEGKRKEDAESAAQEKVNIAQAAKDREEQKFNEALGNYTKAVLYKKTLQSELEEAEEAVKTAKGAAEEAQKEAKIKKQDLYDEMQKRLADI